MSARRTHWRSGIAVLHATCALLAACERVGEPLVGHRDGLPEVEVGPVPCTPAPDCMSDPVTPETVTPHAVTELELGECQFRREGCALVGFDEDAGIFRRPTEGCVGPFAAGEFEPSVLASLACEEMLITGGGSATEVRLVGVDWSLVNVTIQSAAPLRIELEGASLREVYIRLEGPIALHVADAVLFEDVSIASPGDGTQQRIELDRVSGSAFAVQNPGATFTGALAITRSALEDSQLFARKLSLESVRLGGCHVESDDFTANDVELESSRLLVGSGTISASLLEGTKVERCSALTLLGVEAKRTGFAACTGAPLRAYGGEIIGGHIDGAIQSDETLWAGVVIGAHAPSDLVIWEGDFRSVSFCAQSRTARFGDGSNVLCSRCDGIWSEPGAACSIPSKPSTFNNYCDALREPPVCSDPLPTRERPTIGD